MFNCAVCCGRGYQDKFYHFGNKVRPYAERCPAQTCPNGDKYLARMAELAEQVRFGEEHEARVRAARNSFRVMLRAGGQSA